MHWQLLPMFALLALIGNNYMPTFLRSFLFPSKLPLDLIDPEPVLNVSFDPLETCSDRGGCGCDCSWASPGTCRNDDGSCCFSCCCLHPSPAPPPSPGPSPSPETCSDRGGCGCDCSWASPGTCRKDDGSCCFSCCCLQPSPTPHPSPGPSPSPGPKATYCPNPASDFNADYGSPQWSSSGWTIHGGARASSKASFDLSGGFIEFDMELSSAHGGVNNNVYITFPSSLGQYCDSGASTTVGCAELDFVENNGHCFSATTWHSDERGSDHDGHPQFTGAIGSSLHVKASWDQAGNTLTVIVNGNQYSSTGLGDMLRQRGAVIYSSQWTGWVPGNCGGDGNLDSSSFTVSNLRIQGKVVQGAEPTRCSNHALANNQSFTVMIV